MLNGWTLALAARDLDDDFLATAGRSSEISRAAGNLFRKRFRFRSPSPEPFDAWPAPFEIAEGVRGFTTPRSKVLGQDSFKGMESIR